MSSRWAPIAAAALAALVLQIACHKEEDPLNHGPQRCIPRNQQVQGFSRHFTMTGELPLSPIDSDIDVPLRKRSGAIVRHISGPRNCVNGSSDEVTAPLTHRAVCPYKWIVTRDNKRIPRDLVEARCTCERRARELAYECQAVHVAMKVLIYDPDCDGYRIAEEFIQMGCVAVLPATAYSDLYPETKVLLEFEGNV